ncbi:SDR family oxidoreductase [Algoriphagus sp. CAU 1643]|uniref:dTDP-4-dehydrorhamnose reductase n=2 Tax=Algoriphagus limi TaxID=2975273 RepID=A0ABT2G5A2_9BACT|nr:SDR family oxidoreductase [Algoriphagus limi]MCS5490379.1 SDR family oxidoreductase [Algoriphagus limi]
MMKNRQRIFITGVNGLLGQKLIHRLLEKDNFEIIGSGRGPCRLKEGGFEYVSLDIEDEEAVKQTLEKYKPDIIIHGAAMTHVDVCEQNQEECYRANVLATKYLLEASQSFKPHFIFVSTDFIFSGEKGPLTEEESPAPVNYYGQTKLEAEELVKQSGLKWAIARTVLVFGISPGLSRTNIVLWVKESLENGKTIQVVNDQYRTPTLAEDLAEGCILIAEKGAEGVFNISGPDFLTPFQMAMQTADFFGLDKSLIQESDSTRFVQPAKRPLRTGFIIEKARKELGFEPKTFRAAIGILAKQIILASS